MQEPDRSGTESTRPEPPVLESEFPSQDRVPSPRLPSGLEGIPQFPMEAGQDPTLGMPNALGTYGTRGVDPEKVREVEDRLISDARAIGNPSDRSLAFDRSARAYILADRWDDARNAIEAGGQAAAQVPDPIVRDIRLQSLVATAIVLADELIRSATVEDIYADLLDARPPRPVSQRIDDINRTNAVVELAGQIAHNITNDNYQSYTISQLAADHAANSEAVARFATRSLGSEEKPPMLEAASSMLTVADQIARLAHLSVWRDQTLVKVVSAAAASAQFADGLRIAREIPHAEARADAQIRLAEAQARLGLNDEATGTYQEAVGSVLAIPLADPRSTIGAVLLDSLLAVGRFDDARRTANMVINPRLRLRALGAVARSMGGRGMADEAIAWINTEVEPGFRDRLLREVNEGLILWLERNRPNGQTNPSFMPDLMSPSDLERVLPRPSDDINNVPMPR